MDILAGLNEQQHAAVTAPDGAVMVLAGPGSGKTRVLTNRIAYLIQVKGIPPWRIMAVTFTNKAAREMRERIQAILGEDLRGLSVGTFHATCARILRREADHLIGYTRDFVIFDTDDQKDAVKQAMADLNIDDKKFNPAKIKNGISAAKNVLIAPQDYQAQDYIGEVIGRVYRRYQDLLVTNNAMDFDDLLMNTVQLFAQSPLVASKYRDQYQYLLIDEFQDTNLTQYSLMRRLVGEDSNIMIVGDADQSIYKWRGADIRNLMRFREDYPNATQILLEQNYRSTQTILDVAKEVIQKNTNRVHKDLFTVRQGGDKIIIEEAYSDLDEASKVLGEIKNLMVQGYNGGDVAIMYRTNAQSRVMEEQFIREGMPYKLVGATRFYGRREIKDVIAYLRTIHNPADEFSLARIINVPKRSIGKKTMQTLLEWARDLGMQPAEAVVELATNQNLTHPFSTRQYRPLYEFGQQLYNWQALANQISVAELLDKILEDIDYKGYLDDGTEGGMDRWANVIEFRNVALIAGEEISLAEFLEEVALVSEVDNLEDEESAPTLLTLHAAKGLEFPIVFLVGLEDGILPHSRSINSEDREEMAEERRLFYVGITRAKDRVYIYHAFQRMNWGRQETAVPSRFLNDIPLDMVKGGSSANHRRAQTKQRMSSWSWDSGGDSYSSSGGGGRSSGRSSSRSGGSSSPYSSSPRGRSQDEDAFRPKSRRTQSRIPSAAEARQSVRRNLPQPNVSFEEEEEREPVSGRKSGPEFETGQKVTHAKFGEGIVVESKVTGADEEVTVAFTDHGIKRLAASLARLEKVG